MSAAATPPAAPPRHVVDRVLETALAEDLGEGGDVTSQLSLRADAWVEATVRARGRGRIAGGVLVAPLFALIDPEVEVSVRIPDGADAAADEAIAQVTGPAAAVFAGERVALNLLGRLCGVATLTARYVAAVEGLRTRIAHTRKTTPGLRALEIYAVGCGGGAAHRFGLDDAALIKDNHIAAAGGVEAALEAVRARAGHMLRVSVEVDTLDQLEAALRHGPDVVLLDNFAPADLEKAVRLVAGRCVTEASGGVTLETVRAIAQTGVDVISVGALTHSAAALDVGLDVTNR